MTTGAAATAAEVARLRKELIGAWRGSGRLEYPTIETHAYREELVIEQLAPGWPLHYLQQTWKRTDEGEAPSHVESGFIELRDDATAAVFSAQSTDRVEIMTGRILRSDRGGRLLDLASTLHGGDDRMVSATRAIEVNGRLMDYSMWMATGRVPEPTLHLTATLTREAGS